MSKEKKENDSSEPAPTFLTPETSEENLVNFTICPNQDCLSPIEILSINQDNNIIVFKCFKENKEFTISIKEYIEKIKDKRNIDEFKDNCKEHKSNNICYCFDCKKHLCNECLKTMNHIYHKNDIIAINNDEIKIFNKYLKTITENKNNQIILSNLQKEIETKNNIILELEEKIKENKINNEKEKEELQKLLDLETQKNLKLKEFSEEQQRKYKKYKSKCQEYKKKSESEQKQSEKNILNHDNYYIYRRGSHFDDNVLNVFKLREDIFQLKQQLDEEKNKTEVLKLLAENEKEKIENYKAKYNQTKKYNATLLNKLKEKEIHLNKDIINENEILKKKLHENETNNHTLRLEIQKLNKEIETFKKKVQKIDNQEKIIKQENDILKNNLNLKEDIIKENNNIINEINTKYEEEKSKNSRLSLEIKELFNENKRLINSQTVIPKSNKNIISSSSGVYKISDVNKTRKSNFGTVLNFKPEKNKKKGNKDSNIRKVETMKKTNKKNNLMLEDKKSLNKSDQVSNDNSSKNRKLKSSDKVLNIFYDEKSSRNSHVNSFSSSPDCSSENDVSELNRKKRMMKINIIKTNDNNDKNDNIDNKITLKTMNTIKENEEDYRNYSSFTSSLGVSQNDNNN